MILWKPLYNFSWLYDVNKKAFLKTKYLYWHFLSIECIFAEYNTFFFEILLNTILKVSVSQ